MNRICEAEKERRLECRLALSSNVRSVADHDGVVVLDIRGGLMLGTNEMGREIWQGIERGLELREIVDHITEATGAPREVVGPDVVAFTEELLSRGLVVEIHR